PAAPPNPAASAVPPIQPPAGTVPTIPLPSGMGNTNPGTALVPPVPNAAAPPKVDVPPLPGTPPANSANLPRVPDVAPPLGPAGAADRPPSTSFDVDLYEPRAGDTYESISREYYNDPRYAAALRAFNNNRPLQGGVQVEVPPMGVLRKKFPQLVGVNPAADPA